MGSRSVRPSCNAPNDFNRTEYFNKLTTSPDPRERIPHTAYKEKIAFLQDQSLLKEMMNLNPSNEVLEDIFPYLQLYIPKESIQSYLQEQYVIFQDNFMWNDQDFDETKLYNACKACYGKIEKNDPHKDLRTKKEDAHYSLIDRASHLTHQFEQKMDPMSARACAYVLCFYTGDYSEVASGQASVAARKNNGYQVTKFQDPQSEDESYDVCCRSPESDIARTSNGSQDPEQQELCLPILYYMAKALSVIPFYWGPTVRCVKLDIEEQDDYIVGEVVCWTQFSSSKRGTKPAGDFKKRNTYFFIYSLTGRRIAIFSKYADEDEVVFPPMSCFLVLRKTRQGDKLHIYLRQVQLGISQKTILWVDDMIFDQKWENKSCMEHAASQGMNHNIQFICKTNTDSAILFLRSVFGQRLKNSENFRIVSDMNRLNETPSENAGARFLKRVRELGFKNKFMIYTSSKVVAEKRINALLRGDLKGDVTVTQDVSHFSKWLTFK